jgi:hypothetical protein
METLKNRFNRAVKQLKQDIDFTDYEVDYTLIINILEPSCNMDFVTTITKITKNGTIYSKQFDDSLEEDWFENSFSDLLNKESKEKVCELVEEKIK